VFPRGLLHFELNVCDGTATAIAALNSQNPGTQIQAVALFNSGISEVVLEKVFGLGEKVVQKIEQSKLPIRNLESKVIYIHKYLIDVALDATFKLFFGNFLWHCIKFYAGNEI